MNFVLRMLDDPMLFRQQAYVAGRWVASSNGETISVRNPFDEAEIGYVPACTAEQVDEAIDVSKAAQILWARLSDRERSDRLCAWYDLIIQNQDDLARIMTLEQGKPLSEARAEILYAASFVRWYAEEARRLNGHVMRPDENRRVIVLKQPVGVTAAITPWNFPAAMITRKAAPALAAGCSMIVKPSELTPFSALGLAVLAERASIPTGLFSVVTGHAREIGEVLLRSPSVRKLSFTGSTQVGKYLMAQSGETVKRLTLELGGNAPLIVFDDADLDVAVQGILVSKFRNAGQTCVCTNRAYIQNGVYEEICARIVKCLENASGGNGMDPGVTIGPLINEAAVAKVRLHVDDALSRGARIIGRELTVLGRVVLPIVLADVPPEALIASEETFGPVLPLFRFESEREAITFANATPLGLAGYVFTRDVSRAWRVSEALECGMVGMNTGAISLASAPFGGVKQSGLGREGGAAGMEEYIETKTLHLEI